jgi:hypothetical protein
MATRKHISVIDPIGPAWEHMVRILFKPFEFKKWLALGFCAFLAQCGEQAGSGGNSWNPTNKSDWNSESAWIQANLSTFIIIVAAVVLVLIGFIVLVTWLGSRGKFMLLDGIVKNRGAVKEPWAEFKTLGNSLCCFTLLITLLVFLCIGVIGGIGALIALPDFQSGTFTGYGIVAIIVTAALLFLYVIACIAITFFMQIFLLPTMYLKRVRAIEAWKLAWAELYVGHKCSSFLLFLMMIVLGIGGGTVAIFAMCATCCIAALPYVSSVVLLPITVFFVCYALMYIQQFGEDWTFFKNMCRFCNYDTHGLESGCACPECGKL